MSRILDADNLVRLPILSAGDALALGTALETQAQALAPLPAALDEALGELSTANQVLRDVLEQQVYSEHAQRKLGVVDQALDASWSAGNDLCKAWVKLPGDSPRHAAAARIKGAIYNRGLVFLQLPCREQWVESQSRLDIIDSHNLSADFDTLGAGDMLSTIRALHREYGDVQGLTAQPPEAPQRRIDALDQARAALRFYVLQVAAHARPSLPGSDALTKALLSPLANWQSPRRSEPESEMTPEPEVIPEPETESGVEPDASAA